MQWGHPARPVVLEHQRLLAHDHHADADHIGLPHHCPSPTPDPNIPPPARAHTPAGAEAFTRYFFAQLNRSWSTADPSLLPPPVPTASCLQDLRCIHVFGSKFPIQEAAVQR